MFVVPRRRPGPPALKTRPGWCWQKALDPVAERIAGPFDVPWSVALLPDGSFLVTERPGHLQHVRPGADTQPVSGIPDVLYVGHGGLLDIAVDPEFADNRLVYVSYLQGDETASSVKVLKARYEENDETLTDEEVIFESSPGASPELLGGRLALTGDGYLFLSLGDRWEREKAQDLSATAATIVRIRTDGTIPDDNPSALEKVRGAKFGAMATATRKASPSTVRPASCGLTSMALRAAMS